MAISSGLIFLAAGSSQRFGRSTPKQFLKLSGEPLFMKSLRLFLRLSSLQEIVFVTKKRNEKTAGQWLKRLPTKKRLKIVEGGAYRGESVRNGLKGLTKKVDVVLVHDAARPLVTLSIINDVVAAAHRVGAALAAWPLPDTLKRASGVRVKKTIPRSNLWLAQTPQGFRSDIAYKCLLNPSKTATDDAELAERRGYPVEVVPGASTNFKVTYPDDLKICQKLLS